MKKYSNYILVFVVFFVAILSLLTFKAIRNDEVKNENKEEVVENIENTEGNIKENNNTEKENTNKKQEENQEQKPEQTPTKETEITETKNITFPYTHNSIPNITITSTDKNETLIGQNDGFTFNIVNMDSFFTDKYGFEFTADIGSIKCEHKNGLYEEEIKAEKNFLINKEYGSLCPIIEESITWYPEKITFGTEESYEPPKESDYKNTIYIYTKVINLRTKNIENSFYIVFVKVNDYYVFDGIKQIDVEENISNNLILQTQELITSTTKRDTFKNSFVKKLKTCDYSYLENPTTKETFAITEDIKEVYAVYVNYTGIENLEVPGFIVAYYDTNTLSFLGTKQITYKNI